MSIASVLNPIVCGALMTKKNFAALPPSTLTSHQYVTKPRWRSHPLCNHEIASDGRPKAFSMRSAISGDSEIFSFRRLGNAGRPTPSASAASVTERSSDSTERLINPPRCGASCLFLWPWFHTPYLVVVLITHVIQFVFFHTVSEYDPLVRRHMKPVGA